MLIDCYECTCYGDYYLDENGEWVSSCNDCPFNQQSDEDEDDYTEQEN